MDCAFHLEDLGDGNYTVFPDVSQAVYDQLLTVALDDGDSEISVSGFMTYLSYTEPPTPKQITQIEGIICPTEIPTIGEWGLISLFLLLGIFGLLTIQDYKKQLDF